MKKRKSMSILNVTRVPPEKRGRVMIGGGDEEKENEPEAEEGKENEDASSRWAAAAQVRKNNYSVLSRYLKDGEGRNPQAMFSTVDYLYSELRAQGSCAASEHRSFCPREIQPEDLEDAQTWQFDHHDPTQKRSDTWNMVKNGCLLATVKSERAKGSWKWHGCHTLKTRKERLHKKRGK